MATIECAASGSSRGVGAANLWYVVAPPFRRVFATGVASSAGGALLAVNRGLKAVGAAGSVGRAKLSDPRGRGVGLSTGAAHLGGTYNLYATGAAVSVGRASLEPHGSMSVIWIMKIR